jgi:hypothetical protein
MKSKISVVCTSVVAVFLLTALPQRAHAQRKEPKMLVTAHNPDPKHLPTLGVWEDDSFGAERKLLTVSAAFPNVPNFICDSWCYESNVTFLSARALDGGKLELRHRLGDHPHVILVTTVTPEPGAVEFAARLELEKAGVGTLPTQLPFVNLCWQLRRAPSFASAPDPYPEFIKRCFIFTEKGRTFLDKTTRRKIPVRAADDKYNNPPWVQMYVGAWQPVPQAGANSWADYSPDRYTTTVMGTVSRDGKYLTAIANDSAPSMSQAWHDCMHNNPLWLPADAPPAKRVWRVKIYAMENNPDALLKRVAEDFPNAKHLKGAAVPMNDTNVFADAKTKTQMLEAYFHRLSAPKPPTFKSKKQWNERRAELRKLVLRDLGLDPLPERVPLNAQIVATKEYDDYRLERVWFQTLPHIWASGWLYVPKTQNPEPRTQKFPAVLNPHGHWENGARHPVVQSRCIGLAKKGYVAFAVDSVHVTDWRIGVCSVGMMTWNNMRALDYLETRPEVDKTKIGCTGASGGGQQTMYLMATDDRVQVAVPTVLISYFERILFSDERTH